MRIFLSVILAMLVPMVAVPARAQSPNTASLVVVVVDQTAAVVVDAKIAVINDATGATREVISGAEGSAAVAALPLTGTYTVKVTKTGFNADDVTGLTLRAGETATVKVKLVELGRASCREREEGWVVGSRA